MYIYMGDAKSSCTSIPFFFPYNVFFPHQRQIQSFEQHINFRLRMLSLCTSLFFGQVIKSCLRALEVNPFPNDNF